MGNFQEIVDIQYSVSQPENALLRLHSLVGDLDRSLTRIATEGAQNFATGMVGRIDLVRSQLQLLIQDANRASDTLRNIRTPGGSGEGRDILEVNIDEAKRLKDFQELTGTQFFSDLKQRAAEMRFGVGGTGVGGTENIEEDWEKYRKISNPMRRTNEIFYSGVGIANSMQQAGLTSQEYSRIARLGEEAAASQEKFGNSVVGTNRSLQEASRSTNLMNSHLVNHLRYIAEAVIIWESFRAVSAIVGGVVEQFLRLEDVSARVGFIGGQTQAQVLSQFQSAAGYGITPEQAAPGIIAAAQLGATGAQQKQAEQLSLVFGAENYTNALQELVATQKRSTNANIENVQSLDFIATAYATAPGDLEKYFDALQQGILLHNTLGLSAEQTGLALLKVSEVSEMSVERIATDIESMRLKIRPGAKSREQLEEEFGITGGTPAEMIRQITDMTAALAGAGQDEKLGRMFEILTGGQQGPQRIKEMRDELLALNQAFGQAGQPLQEFGDLLSAVSETGTVKIDRLSSSWDVLLQTIGATDAGVKSIDYLIGRVETLTGVFEGLMGVINNFGKAFDAVMNDAEGAWNRAQGWGAGNDMGNVGAILLQAFTDPLGAIASESGMISKLLEAIGGGGPQGRGGRQMRSRAGATLPTRELPPLPEEEPEPTPFGGFRDLPEGLDWQKFVSDVQRYEKTIQQQVPEYELDRRTVAFYDESTDQFRKLVGDSNAIRFATDEQRKLMQQITGVFNVPAGGEALVSFFALQQGFRPAGEVDLEGSTASSKRSSSGVSNYIAQITRGSATQARESDLSNLDIQISRGSAVMDRERHRTAIPDRPTYGVSPLAMQISRGTAGQGREQVTSRDQSANMVINNRISVMLDGAVIANHLNTRMYKRLSNRGRGGSAALLTQ